MPTLLFCNNKLGVRLFLSRKRRGEGLWNNSGLDPEAYKRALKERYGGIATMFRTAWR